MKKKFIALIVAGAIFLTCGLVACYVFAKSFETINTMIRAANQNYQTVKNSDEEFESPLISYEDYRALCIVDSDVPEDDVLAEVDAGQGIKSISFNKITYSCNIEVVLKDVENWEEIDRFNQKKTVEMSFSDFRWKIDKVE